MKPTYLKMIEHVRSELCAPAEQPAQRKQFPFRDRFEHTLRVVAWARRLLRVEAADESITLIAAIFHDAGYGRCPNDDHAIVSAEICHAYLKTQGFDARTISRITYLVAMHSEKRQPKAEASPELNVLIDADLLDETGSLCALWDSMDEGAQLQPSYNKTYYRIEEAYTRLHAKQDRMRTAEGLRQYKQNLAHLRSFLDSLRYELCLDDDPSSYTFI